MGVGSEQQTPKLPRRLQLCERVTFYLALSVFKHRFLAVNHSPVSKASTLHVTVGKQSQYCYKTHSLTIIIMNEHK
jgi:hypothetical protein